MARHFGSGVMWATPLQDANGNSIAVPTPFQFGILQDVSIDASFDEKLLYGTGSFPVDSGRGKGKIGLKAKFANINILPFTAAFFGQSVTSGLITSVNDTTGVVAAASVVITPPNSNTFFANLGVRYDGVGTPLIRVASAPASGQYTTTGNGTYVFASADFGKTVFIDYQHMAAASGQLLNVANLPMGLNPTFKVDFSMQRNGKVLTFSWPKVVSNKLAMSSKQEDFIIPELDMSALADDSGSVWRWSSTE
ncbi:hypothetical protein QN372_00810 [Undibacterium sp. RTI2.1]|uniref:hypothetical protein n=1 Tax=unclassified Undibacterium TaxID=2630295 RepID=UPI002AB4BA4D|nr:MULTISPECIES: hypothetical protein [unclassified Undibacterium]MDY7537677.1 hypothetical protein [Undibacterium sp. 5I1]MEB0029279.1 hypothetical protein [Undibacterium sp. RTI2.1]MEB0115587.1 hypothetical protein [Undibacterium sp. RTI2.2]MEB0256414.1 hypothetical protein [Undibacterium sp. 5I1]